MRQTNRRIRFCVQVTIAVAALWVWGSLRPVCVHAASTPNILVLMTDDQTASSMQVMTLPGGVPRLKQEGTTFERYFTSYSLCCPARASFLTGQYPHNHKVLDVRPPLGGYAKLDYRNTLPVWLQQANYYTAHIGKFLNGYGQSGHPLVPGSPPSEIPQGWNEWYGSIDPSTYQYFGFKLNENGMLVTYPKDTAHYQTDVYVQKASTFLQQRAKATDGKPFFLSVAFLAPHAIQGKKYAEPAPRHKGRFASLPLPRPPSFNEADVSDKPSFIQARPLLTSTNIALMTTAYRNSLEALLAVDEGVATLLTVLEDTGQLENTVVIFLSDNGFFYGEHRLSIGKFHPYEESIRIPLVIRGPGIPAGKVITSKFTVNVDVTATILDLANATPGRVQDGRSLLPLMQNPNMAWRSSILVEGANVEAYGWQVPFVAVRGPRYMYAEHNVDMSTPEPEETQFYDLQVDPYQIQSLHKSTSSTHKSVMNSLKAQLDKLKNCAGASCW